MCCILCTIAKLMHFKQADTTHARPTALWIIFLQISKTVIRPHLMSSQNMCASFYVKKNMLFLFFCLSLFCFTEREQHNWRCVRNGDVQRVVLHNTTKKCTHDKHESVKQISCIWCACSAGLKSACSIQRMLRLSRPPPPSHADWLWCDWWWSLIGRLKCRKARGRRVAKVVPVQPSQLFSGLWVLSATFIMSPINPCWVLAF